MDYRIKEFCGKFTIEVKESKKRKWWHKQKSVWKKCDPEGKPHNHIPPCGLTPGKIVPYCETFDTLIEARQRVNEFKKGVIYYHN